MNNITFKEFLCLNEDTTQIDTNINNIRLKLSQLDTQIAQQTSPLLAQKERLQKQLQVLTQQRSAMMKNTATKPASQV